MIPVSAGDLENTDVNIRLTFAAVVIFAIAALIAACGPEPIESPPTTVPIGIFSIKPASVELQAGRSQQFTLTALDQFENPIPGLEITFATRGGSGQIDEDGNFTAGNNIGTFPEGVRVTVINPEGVEQIGTASISVVAAEAIAISAAFDRSCVVTSYGGVRCWGNNERGQIGDGTTGGYRDAPVTVIGLENGVTQRSVSSSHGCALTTVGGVKCWGSIRYLGIDAAIDGFSSDEYSKEAQDVVGLSSGVVAISTGSGQSCAVMTRGGVKCWGFINDGQRGPGVPAQTPVDMFRLDVEITAISHGDLHACVLTVTGGVRCWGRNNVGQLGDGSTTQTDWPVDVVGLDGRVVDISSGRNTTCAVGAAGWVNCWGDVASLVPYGHSNEKTPLEITGFSEGATAVAVGMQTACAVMKSGRVECWGDNDYGQLGNGAMGLRSEPVVVSGISDDVVDLSAGRDYFCAVLSSGAVQCWGVNYAGQLGNGTGFTHGTTPTDVVGMSSGVISVTTSKTGDSTCAL
ncbi:MAG: hypothetical protein V3T49_03575, partial [Dehalococcoidia bacterium]